MPDIRPVQFPTVTRQTEPAGKVKSAPKSSKAEASPLQQIFKNAEGAPAAGNAKLKPVPTPTLPDPVEKAKTAMLKFYQPEKQAAKKTAPLGQVIDIKV